MVRVPRKDHLLLCYTLYNFVGTSTTRVLTLDSNIIFKKSFVLFLTLSEAKSETDLCVCIVSNCSRHQSSSSNVAIACDNELSSIKQNLKK